MFEKSTYFTIICNCIIVQNGCLYLWPKSLKEQYRLVYYRLVLLLNLKNIFRREVLNRSLKNSKTLFEDSWQVKSMEFQHETQSMVLRKLDDLYYVYKQQIYVKTTVLLKLKRGSFTFLRNRNWFNVLVKIIRTYYFETFLDTDLVNEDSGLSSLIKENMTLNKLRTANYHLILLLTGGIPERFDDKDGPEKVDNFVGRVCVKFNCSNPLFLNQRFFLNSNENIIFFERRGNRQCKSMFSISFEEIMEKLLLKLGCLKLEKEGWVSMLLVDLRKNNLSMNGYLLLERVLSFYSNSALSLLYNKNTDDQLHEDVKCLVKIKHNNRKVLGQLVDALDKLEICNVEYFRVGQAREFRAMTLWSCFSSVSERVWENPELVVFMRFEKKVQLNDTVKDSDSNQLMINPRDNIRKKLVPLNGVTNKRKERIETKISGFQIRGLNESMSYVNMFKTRHVNKN